MIRDDWLLQQIQRLVQAVARLLNVLQGEEQGALSAPLEELEREVEEGIGLDLDRVAQMAATGLSALFGAGATVDAEKALLVGLAFAGRSARHRQAGRFSRATDAALRARILLNQALASRPDLDSEQLRALRDALR